MPLIRRHKFFTLIEILIVVSILALLAALSSTFLSSGLGIVKEEELKEKLVNLSQSARLSAQLQGAKQSLHFSRNEQGHWQVEMITAQAASEFTIDDQHGDHALQAWDPNAFKEFEALILNEDWRLLDGEQNSISEEFSIDFFSDGQSTGAKIYLQTGDNGRLFALNIDELTSRITWQEEK